ncbi:MAG TPA: hypothetical protein VN837_04270 [Chloroflexota bacterium]|nr:hypothetical protein [Chloroflexota bacterium]
MADEPTTIPTPPVKALEPTPAPTPEPVVVAKAGPVCKKCKNPLAVYAGTAAHKIGTAFCHVCGVRAPHKG